MTGFTPLEGEPSTLTSGETWTWYTTLADYPQSAGWTIAYYLHGAFNLTISASTGPSDTQYAPTVTAANTATLVTGPVPVTVAWDLYVLKALEKYALRTGTFLVRPNLATPPTAQKTHDEFMLDAIRATLEGRASSDVESYQINGRALNRIPVEQLVRLETRYAQKVYRRRQGTMWGGPTTLAAFATLPTWPPR